jgi:hypothetical protein
MWTAKTRFFLLSASQIEEPPPSRMVFCQSWPQFGASMINV